MKIIKTDENNLKKLLNTLKKEDEQELKFLLGSNYKEEFINLALAAKEKYFAFDLKGNPLAIGGVESIPNKEIKLGQVWLISSKYCKNTSFEIMKYIKNRITSFKKRYDILFNVIYKSNYPALIWLKKLGFKDTELNNNFRIFYFKKGGINFDLRYYTREQLSRE